MLNLRDANTFLETHWGANKQGARWGEDTVPGEKVSKTRGETDCNLSP